MRAAIERGFPELAAAPAGATPGESAPAKFAFTAAAVALAVTLVNLTASFWLPEPPR